jgi:hypothetical protein
MPFEVDCFDFASGYFEVRHNIALFLYEYDLGTGGRNCQDHVKIGIGPSCREDCLWTQIQMIVKEI